jgi:hypothetical protein
MELWLRGELRIWRSQFTCFPVCLPNPLVARAGRDPMSDLSPLLGQGGSRIWRQSAPLMTRSDVEHSGSFNNEFSQAVHQH